jgi:hypothetical protein
LRRTTPTSTSQRTQSSGDFPNTQWSLFDPVLLEHRDTEQASSVFATGFTTNGLQQKVNVSKNIFFSNIVSYLSY